MLTQEKTADFSVKNAVIGLIAYIALFIVIASVFI